MQQDWKRCAAACAVCAMILAGLASCQPAFLDDAVPGAPGTETAADTIVITNGKQLADALRSADAAGEFSSL